MLNSLRLPGVPGQRFLSRVAVLGLVAFAGAARAQTAPQLLPYTSRLIAGGGTAVVGAGATCPVSGNKSLDAYGDGCLATEIEIGNTAAGGATPGARGAVGDANGNVFFTDYNNGLVRRVDAITGIVSLVAGGGTMAAGTSSGALGTAVKLVHPAGIAFNTSTGDLYFSDPGTGQVFKIAATGGFITSSGVISLVVGNASGTYGYGASNATTTVTVGGTNSYLRSPYGIAFDTKGDLFIVDEYTEAIVVANTNTTGSNTVNGVVVPAGTIWKVAGSSTAGSAASPTNTTFCTNGTSGYGCSYGLYVENVAANGDEFDSTYSVAVGPDGTVYAGNEYYDSIFKVSPAGTLSTFAGKQNSVGTKPIAQTTRAPAGSFGIGSPFGVAADTSGNVYFTDSSSGFIWRVDAGSLSNYIIAGGAATVCSTVVDAYGDGCPALQATFGHSGTGNYASATLPGPGIYGVSVDPYSDLFVGDTETNLVREVASGSQFGVIGANQPSDTLDIHFAVGDSPATAGAYTLTAGASNFSLGTAKCTTNSDNTMDCLLPVQATPTALGAFTGTLRVQSALNGASTFPLSGYYAQSPQTRTSVAATSTGSVCSGSTVYPTSATITLTSTLTANGPSAPMGTITFYANGTPLAPTTGVAVSNLGTSSSPLYGATLAVTFPTVGTYAITATYSGDSYFKTSNSTTAATVTTSAPGFSTAVTSYQQSSVVPGQTALYSFNIAQNVYTGTITSTCSGLPANSSCVFSPSVITAAGCSTTSTVALSILTQAQTTVQPGGLGFTGRGPWQVLTGIAGALLALMIGLRRRRVPMRYGQLWMLAALLAASSSLVACGKGVGTVLTAGTPPSGTAPYSITITTTGSAGGSSSFTVPLTVQ